MNSISPVARSRRQPPDQKGIHDIRPLADPEFDGIWESLILPGGLKDRLLSQAVLNFTARARLQQVFLPLHGIILLVGLPGTGKTSLARGLASRTAASLGGKFTFLEVDPHALASNALGRSQQAVTHLLGSVIGEQASAGPCIVLLDEVESLAADRRKMSLEANPVDVHRATDAVLTQLDQLAAGNTQLLFIATSNFPGAIDDGASRLDALHCGCDRVWALASLARAESWYRSPGRRGLSVTPWGGLPHLEQIAARVAAAATLRASTAQDRLAR